MKYITKYIDFELHNRSLLYYIAILLIVVSQFSHFLESSMIVTILQFVFMSGYSLLTINELYKHGSVHIATLFYRSVVIVMLLFAIVPKIQNYLTSKT